MAVADAGARRTVRLYVRHALVITRVAWLATFAASEIAT
jgi:hypothetical protein